MLRSFLPKEAPYRFSLVPKLAISHITRTASSYGHPKKPRPSSLGNTWYNHRTRVLADDVETYEVASSSTQEQSDYYSILGITPTASPADIKRAYRRLMKDWHPDQSNDAESNEFAIFLNQVYETLMDVDSRAEYDVIAGFSSNAINPFMDSSYPREFAFVDEFSCIGCRNCNNVCHRTFGMEEDYGRARVMRQSVDPVDKVQEAIDTCPVSCIHWVTAPQLTLLEETMAKMERIDAWKLLTGGGKGANLNVFVEASVAWEKRQAALRAREQKARWAWAPFTPAAGSSMQDAARQGAGESGSESEGENGGGRSKRRVSAMEMASAARKWRDYQRVKQQRRQKLLSGPE